MIGERGHFRYDPETKSFVKIDRPQRVQKPVGIITDEIAPTESYATFDAPIFTSRSKLRQHYRQHGYVETGGDHLNIKPRAKTQEDLEREAREDKELVEQAYMDVKYQRVPFTEKEKQLHYEEQRKWGKNYKVKSPV